MTIKRTFTVVLEPAEEGGFIVHVPALPEVHTQGDTEAEALTMAAEAIELAIEQRIEDCRPVPRDEKPEVRQVTVDAAA